MMLTEGLVGSVALSVVVGWGVVCNKNEMKIALLADKKLLLRGEQENESSSLFERGYVTLVSP